MQENSLIVFVSSTTGEAHLEALDKERDAAKTTIEELGLTRAWVWEEGAATASPPPDVYLPAVRNSDIFILILGKDVTKAVTDEYNTASGDSPKPILVFVKLDQQGQAPESRMSSAAKDFLAKIKKEHSYKTFITLEELKFELKKALCNELSKACRAFWRTPASRKQSEGADDTILLIGAGELGLEIARSLRKYSGNRVVLEGIDRYNTPPARDELHSFVVVPELPWKEDQLLNEISQLKPRPNKILPELMATPPGLFKALQTRGYTVIPHADILERLLHRITYRRDLDDFLMRRPDIQTKLTNYGVQLPRWQPVSNETEIDNALNDFGQALFLKPAVTDLGLGQSYITTGHVINRKDAISDAWSALSGARYGGRQEALVEEYVDFETEIYQVVVRTSGQDIALDPVEYRRQASLRDLIGGPWQLEYSVQPPILKGKADHERDMLLTHIRETSLLLVHEWIASDGFFGFEYFVKGSDLWLNKITFRPDINGIVTVFSARPSIFDIYAKFVLGHALPVRTSITPAACCPKLWPDNPGAGVHHRFVIKDIDQIRCPDVEVFPIDKHEMNPRDRVAFIVAWADSASEAL